MSHRIALLSNVNMSYVIRILKKNYPIYEGQGYGNELGELLDPNSAYHAFVPNTTFVIVDLLEILEQNLSVEEAESKIEKWFMLFSSGIDSACQYYVSDAFLWGAQLDVLADRLRKQTLENMWNTHLLYLCEKHKNVHVFSYHSIISRLGEENSFSLKTWYMGKILHTMEAQKRIGEEMLHYISLVNKAPKKVLVLDLDNTLWGGLAGENDVTPIILSDEHDGLAYKNLQRVIALMREAGVVIAIVSKNNEEDALSIIRNHPHMVLKETDFVIKEINWEQKDVNISRIAYRLNLGLDSFVFFDDNPTERELVKKLLPMVEVPDFPERPEELAERMCDIYHSFFEKPYVTEEDMAKTKQYAENIKRDEAQSRSVNFETYLQELQIKIERTDAVKNAARLLQLVNKTNQFNLTTRRYSMEELQNILKNSDKRIYLYRIEDGFGDYGIVCALIVDVSKEPIIEEFVLSCRVMGKYVEYGIVSMVEKELRQEGYEVLRGLYIPTPKNKPVEYLFDGLEYEQIRMDENGVKLYQTNLKEAKNRTFYATFI